MAYTKGLFNSINPIPHYTLTPLQKAFLKFILKLSEYPKSKFKITEDAPYKRILENGYYEASDREHLNELTKDMNRHMFMNDSKLKTIWIEYKNSLNLIIRDYNGNGYNGHGDVWLDVMLKEHFQYKS